MPGKGFRLGVWFLLLIIFLGCSFPFASSQEARRAVKITIDSDRRQEFFDQLRKFAKANGFSILIDTSPESNKEFQIYMQREDIIIHGLNFVPLNEYQIAFSDVTERAPAPDSVFDYLVSELERYISEVPGTTISTVK